MSEKNTENSTRNKIYEICLIPLLALILFVGKWALKSLPNIETVSFFIILFSLNLRKRTVFPAVFIFVLLEGIFYGFTVWWIMYLYVWPLLAVFVYCFRRIKSPAFWAISSGIYGLLFGLLCTMPYFFTKGWSFGVSWWIAGLSFDFLHAFGNYAVCRLLFIPVNRALGYSVKKYLK